MNPNKYTPQTLIRKLKSSTIKELSHVLDPENELHLDWRGFASRVPKRPGSSELRYDMTKIVFMTHRMKTNGKSPTESMMSDLCTINATVGDVVKILEDMGNFEAILILLPEYEKVQIEQDKYKALDSKRDIVELPINLPNITQQFSPQEVTALTDNFDENLLSIGGRNIGEGGFGKVFLGFFKDGTKCAVKKLNEDGLSADINLRNQLEAELKTLMCLTHLNLVKIYGYCPENLCLILEYIPFGNLKERLACKDGIHQPLSWKERMSIALGTARGIKFLHENNYIHRDIKSANILIGANLVPKLADFGLVRQIKQNTQQMTTTNIVIGTNVYLPPESFGGHFSYKSDVYSFGVVLLEVITGLPAIDNSRQPSDIITRVEEEVNTVEDIFVIIDKKSALWKRNQVLQMYKISEMSLLKQSKRLTMTEVFDQLLSMNNSDEPSP